MKYDGLIDSIQKFRFEYMLYFVHHAAFHMFIVLFCILYGSKSKLLRRNDGAGSGIGGHDDNCIFKVHLPSLGIGNMPVIQYL